MHAAGQAKENIQKINHLYHIKFESNTFVNSSSMLSSIVRGRATLCFKNPLAASQSCINSDSDVDFPDTTCIRIALNANRTADGSGSLTEKLTQNALSLTSKQTYFALFKDSGSESAKL